MDSSDELEFLSREALLEGRLAPGRRANALLFAIESRTAQCVADSRLAAAQFLTKKAVEERERAFLEALAAGRDLPVKPTIQDLERYAAHWTDLVSEADSRLRAAVAHALGKKYAFTSESVPSIRAALGLDAQPVMQAYERLYAEPLPSIYAPRVAGRDRVRWVLSGLARRLEGLPPFWVAFALTLPLGPGLLALPIAVAGVGVPVAVLLLVLFGLINALTVAALAEAVARAGTTRFGLGYLGQLVSEYLGGAGSLLLTAILALDNFLVLIIFYVGFAGTLETATRLPAEVWVLALFVLGLYFLSRRSLNSTVASTLVVTAVNVALVVIIPLFAVPFVRSANLAIGGISLAGGKPFDLSVLQPIFGVLLANYFSHMLVANYGRVIIRRDRSARSWILGAVAAIGLTTLVSCLWVVLCNGALSPEALARSTGTALTALAELAGPVVSWLGSLFVVLSLGMASIHVSLGLLFLAEERLPAASRGRWGARGRFLLSISPVVAGFLVAEWLSFTGRGSFAGLLGFVGVIALPLLGGIFPALLLAATRRKGDYVPGLVLRFLGSPVVLGGIYLLFLGSILVYGLFIFQGIAERAATLLVGVAVLVVTLIMLRRGALQKRAVVELREEQGPAGESAFTATANGQPVAAEVTLEYADGRAGPASGRLPTLSALRRATLHLPATGARELKAWAHRITPEGRSEALPARVILRCGAQEEELDLAPRGGQVILPITGEACQVEIAPAGPSREEAT